MACMAYLLSIEIGINALMILLLLNALEKRTLDQSWM